MRSLLWTSGSPTGNPMPRLPATRSCGISALTGLSFSTNGGVEVAREGYLYDPASGQLFVEHSVMQIVRLNAETLEFLDRSDSEKRLCGGFRFSLRSVTPVVRYAAMLLCASVRRGFIFVVHPGIRGVETFSAPDVLPVPRYPYASSAGMCDS